jgi:hypothetical protein
LNERGFTTIEYVMATALSLLLFLIAANLLVDVYERGALRDALDEGVRAGVPIGANAQRCETAARAVINSVAPSLHPDELSCAFEGTRVVARAHVSLPSWLPMLIPPWHLDLRSQAVRER